MIPMIRLAPFAFVAALAACGPAPDPLAPALSPHEARNRPAVTAAELPTEGWRNRPAWQYWGFSGAGRG